MAAQLLGVLKHARLDLAQPLVLENRRVRAARFGRGGGALLLKRLPLHLGAHECEIALHVAARARAARRLQTDAVVHGVEDVRGCAATTCT